MEYDDIIDFENESTRLDFKAIQYDGEKHEALLKDVMSMANADVEGEKLIVVGVNHKANGERDIVGIKKEEFIDSSNYQQLIRKNIEPYIEISYEPHKYNGENEESNGKFIGIIKIKKSDNKPYMMKKKYEDLNQGDCFVRKGTQQDPMTRNDIVKIFKNKTSNNFEDNVKIGFIDTDYSKKIKLSTLEKEELPSDRAENEIKRIIAKKENGNYNRIDGFLGGFSLTNSYENLSIEELENKLKNTKNDYKDEDWFELFDDSYSINLEILNEDKNYIEDATFKLEIPNLDNLHVFYKFHEDPSAGIRLQLEKMNSFNPRLRNYPDVIKNENKAIVKGEIGDIKHFIPTNIYKEPFRLWINSNLSGETIEMRGILYGKNLAEPIKKSFFIEAK